MKSDGFSYNGGIWKEFISDFITTTENQKDALRNSLRDSAEELLLYAREQVPEDTKFLKTNSYVEDLGDQFDVVFTATAGDRADAMGDENFSGDRDYNYAWIQHEATWFKHKKGKAHYLSDPFNEHKEEWLQRASSAIRKASAFGGNSRTKNAKKSWNKRTRRGW